MWLSGHRACTTVTATYKPRGHSFSEPALPTTEATSCHKGRLHVHSTQSRHPPRQLCRGTRARRSSFSVARRHLSPSNQCSRACSQTRATLQAAHKPECVSECPPDGTSYLKCMLFFKCMLGTWSGFDSPGLDRPGRLPHQQGLCEARLGYRDRSPQLGAPGPETSE